MGDGDLKARLCAFLASLDTGADAATLAEKVLKLQGARGAIAEKVVQAAVDGDPRFLRTADGMWMLKPAGSGRSLKETAFLCFGVVEGADVVELAGRRVQAGAETRFPAVQIGSDSAAALLAFSEFASGAVPVAFQFSRRRQIANRLGRFLLGRPILDAGICLYRLGRRAFPDAAIADLEELAAAMGLTFVADRGADGEAGLLAEVLLRLLSGCEALGLSTVEAVMADLYPDPAPVRFESYAFDEQFLRELPEAPGVYVMRDRAGCVIYVGKAVDLRRRVGSYFVRRSERAEKTRRILDRIWSMEVETVGSELEALLLEARMIALCRPEFNTQVQVHDRAVDLGALKNWALVLPSAEPDCVELFCSLDGQALFQARVRQDLRDWDGASAQIQRRWDAGAADVLSEAEQAELQIVRSWLMAQKDEVNVVDMDAQASRGDTLRVLSEYAQQCEGENWEKVVWRV